MSKEDDTEEFLGPLQPSNGPSSDNETETEEQKDNIRLKNKQKSMQNARDVRKLLKEYEDNNQPAGIDIEGNRKKHLPVHLLPGEKGKLLRELKKIWSNPKNKGSEITSAASLFAEIMGFKTKINDTSEGEIMKIIFDIAKPPANKMISEISTKETTNTTTTPATTPTNNANETGQLEPLDDANKVLDEQVDELELTETWMEELEPTTTLDNATDNKPSE